MPSGGFGMLLLLAMMMAADKPVGPYRDAEISIRSDQPATDLVPCIARVLGRAGNVAVLPVKDGSAIDLQDKGTLLGLRGTPRFSMQVVDNGEQRLITATYRHPISGKLAQGFVRDAGRKCFAAEWMAQAPAN
jgi:hypothetical protein